jgi:hypothetical protein
MKQASPSNLGASSRWLVYHVAAWWTLLAALAGIWLYNTSGKTPHASGWHPLPIDHYVVIFVVTTTLIVYTGSRWRQAAHSAD